MKRGCMLSPWPSDEDILELISWGANIVRWPIFWWPNEVDNWSVAEYRENLQSRVSEILDKTYLFQDSGIKIIVDMHTPVGGVVKSIWGQKHRIFVEPEFRRAFIENWKYLAAVLSHSNIIKGFDLLNEPLLRRTSKWQELAQETAEEVREYDGKPTIIIEPKLSDPRNIKYLKPLKGINRVWYSVHMYLPRKITFQGVGFKIGRRYPDRRFGKSKLREFLEPARIFQLKHDVQIYVGEFSCARWSGYPRENAFYWMKHCIELFEEFGWHWSYHAFRESGIWNVEYSNKPCPNGSSLECIDPDLNSRRKQLLLEAFNKNA